MIGLTRYDDNETINEYKAEFGVNNPCAGVEGNAGAAIDTIIDGQTYYGTPTYCVICPDKKMQFNVCFPPTPECFDDYIYACGATSNEEIQAETEVSIYPNPAGDLFTLSFGDIQTDRIEIMDMLGKTVKTISTDGLTRHLAIQVNDLKSGLYFIRITDRSGQIITKKLTIK